MDSSWFWQADGTPDSSDGRHVESTEEKIRMRDVSLSEGSILSAKEHPTCGIRRMLNDIGCSQRIILSTRLPSESYS